MKKKGIKLVTHIAPTASTFIRAIPLPNVSSKNSYEACTGLDAADRAAVSYLSAIAACAREYQYSLGV